MTISYCQPLDSYDDKYKMFGNFLFQCKCDLCVWQENYQQRPIASSLPKPAEKIVDELKKYELCKKMFKDLMSEGFIVEIHNQAIKALFWKIRENHNDCIHFYHDNFKYVDQLNHYSRAIELG